MWKMYLSKYEFVREIFGLKKESPKPKVVRRRRPVESQVFTYTFISLKFSLLNN